ncbi:MAG: helix-turn-helix domain-containing protein [Ruminococcaceae bacterium]|nr:helix-turn-helix domain-containing protein [Oscillospiraceae bacterium]
MNEELKELAQRISGLRDACGYTQEELAEELGIELSVYQDYEENGKNIPISVIYEIANKFGVDFNEIMTGTRAKLDTYHIIKSGKGKSIDRYPGYGFKDLAHRYVGKIMQPLLVTLDPSDTPADLVSHSGQEFNYVLSGRVAILFDGEEFILETGDSIYFNATYPHGQRCVGNEPGVFLTVISE